MARLPSRADLDDRWWRDAACARCSPQPQGLVLDRGARVGWQRAAAVDLVRPHCRGVRNVRRDGAGAPTQADFHGDQRPGARRAAAARGRRRESTEASFACLGRPETWDGAGTGCAGTQQRASAPRGSGGGGPSAAGGARAEWLAPARRRGGGPAGRSPAERRTKARSGAHVGSAPAEALAGARRRAGGPAARAPAERRTKARGGAHVGSGRGPVEALAAARRRAGDPAGGIRAEALNRARSRARDRSAGAPEPLHGRAALSSVGCAAARGDAAAGERVRQGAWESRCASPERAGRRQRRARRVP
jgi:hypothetical protein